MPHIFLAYSRDDRRIMEPLRDYLRARGIHVWTDEHIPPKSPNYLTEIQRAIQDCRAMVVLLSPNANTENSFVHNEISYAQKFKKSIYPVLIAGNDQTSVPISLVNYNYTDIRGRIQQTVDEVYNQLALTLANDLGIELREPSSTQINVTVEGNIKGDVNVAGRDIAQTTQAMPSAQKTLPWTWIIVIGALAVIGIIGLSALQGNGRTESPAAEEPTQTEVIAEEETPALTTAPPSEPTTAPSTPTPDPAWLAIAEAGVTNNNQWEPYIQEFEGVQMALVPAGCFQMGSTEEDIDYAIRLCEEMWGVGACERNWFDDQQPAHEVCFEKPFWIDVYEVTNEAFGSAGCHDRSSEHDQPRNCINWAASSAYCESRQARLPSEAEWEYAARGPNGLKFPWGNTFVADNAIYAENNPAGTAPVSDNPDGVSWIGAYHLSGNVWEWVNDWYANDYYVTLTLAIDIFNPQGPDDGTYHVHRGGGWHENMYDLLSTRRSKAEPIGSSDLGGFRCASDYNTENAEAESSPTVAEDIPPLTVESARSPAFVLAEAGVSSNDEWEPYIQEFDGVQMALVPVGCFMMGSNNGDIDEMPVHEVCFDKPFWIDVYEITNEQYGSAAESCLDRSSGANQPRVCIDWFESLEHCEAHGSRLPTEAEWEYAARGPGNLIYPWGNTFDGTLVNFCDKNCGFEWLDVNVDDGYKNTAPVGSYTEGVSWVGVYDLSGNVWEWINDWYGKDYYANSATNNPQGPESGDERVLLGGSWYDYGIRVQARNRISSNPDDAAGNIGFRCARDYEP